MSALVLRNFMASIIEYPKVLVAAVNGPAIGIAATMLGVFDAVYLSDQALLRTPFVSTAQAPEGCASYTFPRIMGRVKVLLLMFFFLKYFFASKTFLQSTIYLGLFRTFELRVLTVIDCPSYAC